MSTGAGGDTVAPLISIKASSSLPKSGVGFTALILLSIPCFNVTLPRLSP